MEKKTPTHAVRQLSKESNQRSTECDFTVGSWRMGACKSRVTKVSSGNCFFLLYYYYYNFLLRFTDSLSRLIFFTNKIYQIKIYLKE